MGMKTLTLGSGDFGSGVKLVMDTLPLAATEYVEMSAVMAKYNPFAEKTGMRKVAEQPPSREALKVTEMLEQFGFNIQFLGSTGYVQAKLRTLKKKDIAEMRQAFIRNARTRFLKFRRQFGFIRSHLSLHIVIAWDLERFVHSELFCN
jgi:hypothetical protein